MYASSSAVLDDVSMNGASTTAPRKVPISRRGKVKIERWAAFPAPPLDVFRFGAEITVIARLRIGRRSIITSASMSLGTARLSVTRADMQIHTSPPPPIAMARVPHLHARSSRAINGSLHVHFNCHCGNAMPTPETAPHYTGGAIKSCQGAESPHQSDHSTATASGSSPVLPVYSRAMGALSPAASLCELPKARRGPLIHNPYCLSLAALLPGSTASRTRLFPAT